MIPQQHRHDARDNEEQEGDDSELIVEEGNTTPEEHDSSNTASTPTCRDLVGRVMVVETSHTKDESTQKSFGCPKGTTMIYSQDLKERVRLVTAEVATKYRDVREKAKLAYTRAKQGSLSKIVVDAKHKHAIIDAKNISIQTVRTRAKRNNLSPAVCQGTPSPMLRIEPYLVVLFTHLSRITCRLMLQLVCSLQILSLLGLHLNRSLEQEGKNTTSMLAVC
jgi:hypothetical protein